MAKQTFTAGQVLTAAQQNSLQGNDYNQTVSTKTASYTLVAADAGTRVVMNAAGATTITVNTSLFSAGDTLVLQNIGAGTCTVTAGTATVSSAGPLAIPQYGSGTLYFTSTGVSIYFPSAVTASSGALTLITTGTLSAASSVTVDTCFTSTYDEYKLLVDVTGSTSASLTLQMRNAGSTISTANYQWFRTGFNKDGATDNAAAEGQSSWLFGYLATIPSVFVINIFSPLDNANQQQSAFGASTNAANSAAAIYSTGMRYNQNQVFDSFVMSASSGNMTGTVRVYGFSK